MASLAIVADHPRAFVMGWHVSEGNRVRGFKRNPVSEGTRFNNDMLEMTGLATHGKKPRRVADAFEERREKYCLVVTVSRALLKNLFRRVQRFDFVHVPHITDIIAHKLKKRVDLTRLVFLLQMLREAQSLLSNDRALFALPH